MMKKRLKRFCEFFVMTALLFCICAAGTGTVSAAPKTYTVASGDTLWEIAQKFEIGLGELIKANPQIKNPGNIDAGDKINIPESASLAVLEDEVIRLVNAARDKYGLPPLEKNREAAKVARIKAQDMIEDKYFSHNSPSYGSPFSMMENFGLRFSSAAENIAQGQKSAAEAMNSWMSSPGHRANILSRTVTQIGVGAAKTSNGTMYWVQLFIKPY